mmetsp:Transcript_98356/g.278541  ORF Transcript_98356/g.278541 Transcript_98356/m.278541 type:complete len:292 (-) Transcript_98356:447-1322(-)
MFSRGERSLYWRASSWPTSERKPLLTPGCPTSWPTAAMSSVICSSSVRKLSQQVICMVLAVVWTTSTAWAKLWNGTGRYSFSTAATKRCRSCTSSGVLKRLSPESWKRETEKTVSAIRWALVRGSGLKDQEAKTSWETPKSSSRMEGSGFLRAGWLPEGLRPSGFFSSVMFLPCIMLRMPMSSSRMPSVFWGTVLAVCRSAMIASFCTTFSRSFISLELSMSTASSSSLVWTFELNLKTVLAMCRTVASMRSRGRTASSVTTLERAMPLKSMMMMMKHIVAMARAASSCAA